jgi:hypothetical protein
VTRAQLVRLWRAGQHGWPRSYPIAQFPNAQLAVGAGASIAGRVTDGSVHDYASALSYLGLAAWASDELLRGTNALRRALGAGMLVYLLVQLREDLGR